MDRIVEQGSVRLRATVTRLRAATARQGQALSNAASVLDVATQHIPRTAIVDLTALAVGTTTKTATWSVPVSGDYRVVIQPVIASARLGTIFATIVAGTKGATSVDIAVVNSGPSTMAAGILDVVIHPA